MPESKWLKLIYTCDCEGDYMRLGGKIFPGYIKERLFDVRLPEDAYYYPKCLVQISNFRTTARAITQNGDIVKLKHGDLLRPVNDKETQRKLEKIEFDMICAENTAARIKDLKYRKKKLTAELKKVTAELAKLKK
ncbi:MAG: hypothetical protein KKD35_01745 [Elusimicrobia bacterium]|nr:hypothetical protein [Elusimicrobiota bacterium]